MIAFDDIKPGARLRGLTGGGIAEIVQVARFGADALNLVFRVDGRVAERLVYRGEETAFELVESGHAYGFDADGALLRLASEAYRIRLAHLFDPYLAISASQIEALPHQITAVYGEMLPRQPLRFLLADDPGAGKTIMAGLLIKELLIRGDLDRCLIVAPGNLVEQWQDELAEKFGLHFEALTRDQIETSVTGNPFAERNRLIMRLDMAARSDELKAKLSAAPEWDLVICDEAHRMSASYFGGEVKETQRYKLGRLVGTRTRNLLLMSATPHNGKEADFQLFMGLLDADRFEGRFREGIHKADVSDMMRRLTKEELYRFDGAPLFPERRAYTASYELSSTEADLYQAVTTYVREEMNRADRNVDGARRNNVGFALQILQRRLASSPAAIHRSLERRLKRLEERLREERLGRDSASAPLTHGPSLPAYDPEELDEAPGAEAEEAEQTIVDSATAAQTLRELEAEIAILNDLEARALLLKLSGQDAKWRELESILDEPLMVDAATGLRRKLLIFTEPKDTLEYLAQKIIARFGDAQAVVVVHGGIARAARRAAIAAFNSDPVVRVMVANDAAGEGVNLQRGAHLMVNYDLPWNPNRLEQRFGRIHRIGQTEVCHLWNLCATNTREGEVYRRLLEKLEEARAALGGKVYDVLGELFEGQALRDLLVDAIRYGDRPEKKAELFRKVDGAVDVATIERLVAERKLTSEGMDPNAVSAIREEMERAQARRLQPHFIGAFFREAFALLGGRIAERERGRFEISRVPSILKERDRLIGRADPVLDRYARVTFDKSLITGQPQAELLAPGHPLLDAAVDVILERFQPLLAQGAVLVDGTDPGTEPRVLVYLEHAIRDGRVVKSGEPRAISQRLQFIQLAEGGTAADGGAAPYLDYRPITAEERQLIADVLTAPWLASGIETRGLGYAIASLVPQHLAEVKRRRLAEIDKVEREVRARLNREINYWDARAARLREEERAGKEQRINATNAEATAQRLVERLHARQAELDRERQISALPPVLRGAALVIPQGLLDARAVSQAQPMRAAGFAYDPDARAEVESRAMEAVMAAERQMGFAPRDVSGEEGATMTTQQGHIEGIARLLADYRKGEIEVPDPEHVACWLHQFDPSIRAPFISEIHHVLGKTYIDTATFEGFYKNQIKHEKLTGGDPATYWKRANFLRIQSHGSSQRDALGIFGKALKEVLGLSLSNCGGAGDFIYLDDILFSGNRVGGDLEQWIANQAPPSATVHVLLMATHAFGEWSTKNRLAKAASNANKKIDLHIWRCVTVENRKTYRNDSDVLWPTYLPPQAAGYDQGRFPLEPRSPGGKSAIFSSEEARQLLEQTLLIAGLRIRSFSQNSSAILRPLGFGPFGVGFGTTFVSYRNCPNNAPLALWWGDPDADPSHSFSKWRPLVLRKTYGPFDNVEL